MTLRHRLFDAFADRVIRCANGKPTLVARRGDGKVFMRCWQPAPMIHVHQIVRSDDAVFHDHEWNFASLILRGGYTEVTPEGQRQYAAGSLRLMRADRWHFVNLEAGDAWSLVITGPRRQHMGFLVDGVKLSAQDYLQLRAQREARNG